jgi:hypothetical protein
MNKGLIKLSKQVFNFRLTRFITTTSCDEFSTTSDFCIKNLLEKDKKKNDWVRFDGDPADMSKILKDYRQKCKDLENQKVYYDKIYNVNKDGSLELTDEHYLKEEEFIKKIKKNEDPDYYKNIYENHTDFKKNEDPDYYKNIYENYGNTDFNNKG